MDELANSLMEELECRTAFEIPIFGGIPVPESCVITWVIMAVLVILCKIFVRNLKTVPTGAQLLIEMLITWLNNFFVDIMGQKGKKYLPFLETLIIYIGVSNVIGLFGLRPPTKDLNVTAGLAIMSIIYIQYCGIKEKGVKRWLRSFKEPMPLLLPINIMELVKLCIPVGVPLILSLYFDVFDGLIQAYVFVFLTSLFMAEAMEEE